MRPFLALFAIIPLTLLAQNQPPRPVVRASGEATVTAKPDCVQIDIGVVTQASKAEAAASQNAARTTAALNEIKSLLHGAGEIQTINYSLNPNYRYAQNSSPSIEGYTASNIVQVTLDDLTLVGKVIDAATASGSNNVNGIRFMLKNNQASRSEALQKAARQAKANAEAIAQALGLRVIRVLSAESGEASIPRPMNGPMMAMAKAAPTPIETGTIDVHATVTVTLEVAP